MCGIIGYFDREESADLRSHAAFLFDKAVSRGSEASGVALWTRDAIKTLKCPAPPRELLRLPECEVLWKIPHSRGFVGHARMATNGRSTESANNHPIVKDGLAAIHNGIIVNDGDLWRRNPDLRRGSDVDTEVFLALLARELRNDPSVSRALGRVYAGLQGTVSAAVFLEDRDALLLTSNNGSLHWWQSPEAFVFASEAQTIMDFAKARLGKTDGIEVRQIEPGTGLLYFPGSFQVETFVAGSPENRSPAALPHPLVPVEPVKNFPAPQILDNDLRAIETLRLPSADVRRCRRCILPETVPFIRFNDQGICHYCENHKPRSLLGLPALHAKAEELRRRRGRGGDLLVMFSGGRDSSYGLHYVVRELGLKAVTFTYDWGVITDLARRNQARLCGKLGVENILVSADLAEKRRNIRLNLRAWLKRPRLGLLPILMAGDKQYFHHANRVQRELGLPESLMAANPYEKTDFKAGFCGVPPASAHGLSPLRQARLAGYYAKEFLLNPAYLNASIPDTLGAYASFYMIPHDYLRLFDYIEWNEDEINRTLLGEYDWETAPDTTTTWRIGDGTAPFYNYVYTLATGFSENDSFRSHQVRQGLLSREQALALVERENRPLANRPYPIDRRSYVRERCLAQTTCWRLYSRLGSFRQPQTLACHSIRHSLSLSTASSCMDSNFGMVLQISSTWKHDFSTHATSCVLFV